MKKSAFIFFKGLGLLFAVLCGIGTAILGWYDGADWINIVSYSLAVSALILWGWYHFSIRWIHGDLKQDIFSQISKKENIDNKELAPEDYEENFLLKNIRQNRWVVSAFILMITIFIFISFIADGFFFWSYPCFFYYIYSFHYLYGGYWPICPRSKKCFYWYFSFNWTFYYRIFDHPWIPFTS